MPLEVGTVSTESEEYGMMVAEEEVAMPLEVGTVSTIKNY